MNFATTLDKLTSFTIAERDSGVTVYPAIKVEDTGFFQSLEDLERIFFLTDNFNEEDFFIEMCEDTIRAFKWIRQALTLSLIGNDSEEVFYPKEDDVSMIDESQDVDDLLLLSHKIEKITERYLKNNRLP